MRSRLRIVDIPNRTFRILRSWLNAYDSPRFCAHNWQEAGSNKRCFSGSRLSSQNNNSKPWVTECREQRRDISLTAESEKFTSVFFMEWKQPPKGHEALIVLRSFRTCRLAKLAEKRLQCCA